MKLRISILLLWVVVTSAAAFAQSDWPTYGGDLAGTRYSPLKQINTTNVSQLKRVWTYHQKVENPGSGSTFQEGNEVPPARNGAPAQSRQGVARPSRGANPFAGLNRRTSEVTPLVVNDVMYITTAYDRIAALQPETGKEIWVYEVKEGTPSTRGLEYWPGDKESPPTLFFGTSKGKLLALNATNGKPISTFGDKGVVDLKAGALNRQQDGFFDLSSPPIVYKSVVITGAHVQESPSIGPSGDTHAWDVHTGKLVWTFHNIPHPGEPGSDTWHGDDWKGRSGTNTWGLFTIDAERGILYMPIGEPTTDYWGGDRPGANLFGTSLVAVDALTGKLKWFFQGVHHDTWDYDFGAPPVLLDIHKDGQTIPAVAELTKTGALFIFDRVTGKPVFGVEERPIPTKDALPGDPSSPTQPLPIKPPLLARNSFTREEITNVTPEQQRFCQELFDSIPGGLHSGPAFTHYSTTPSVIFPSSIGGGNWNPPSYDPTLGYLFVNTQDFGSLNTMVKNDDASYSRVSYKGINRFWNPENNMPCNQTPWGRLFAINVNTGDIAWQVPLGITDSLPEGKQNTGRPNLGGSVATAGGLIFIGATDDSRFRAFDSKTGKELWVSKIDAGAHSAPITFMGKDGKQYVVVTGTGGGFLGDKSSADSVMAFALP